MWMQMKQEKSKAKKNDVSNVTHRRRMVLTHGWRLSSPARASLISSSHDLGQTLGH